MSQTIAGYTAAVSIDAANDFLLIEPSGNTVYKKISRNVLLGLASAPLGTTDSQSPTNKTFDVTNIYTTRDDRITLQNSADVTKQAKFSLSAITTGTTRTYTLPNATDTLAGIAATQTFTNKTLTSPSITGGTIDNSTITVDSISGHSTSTIVTVANMQISNGVINTANAVTATSIAAGAVQPQALVTGTGSGWAWSSWTPTWTGLTVGSATVSYKYIQIGKTVFFRFSVVLAADSSLSSALCLTLPVTAVSILGNIPVGQCWMTDSGIKNYQGQLNLTDQTGAASTTKMAFYMGTADGTYLYATLGSNSIPFSASTNDILAGSGYFEAA